MTQLELDFDIICAELDCGIIDKNIFDEKISYLIDSSNDNIQVASVAMAIASATS